MQPVGSSRYGDKRRDEVEASKELRIVGLFWGEREAHCAGGHELREEEGQDGRCHRGV